MKKHIFLSSVLIMFTALQVFALSSEKKTGPKKITESCYYCKLDNGLSLFINENHTVPLTYIEIAVRAGAITQTRQTAGLFHLYEHMMFKGNSLFDNSAKVQKALSDMGTASWNGTTGLECVNYFFTIPSSELENGLKFWNAAIREPLMDEKELEIEKKVVISEIQGNESSPDRYIGYYINSCLFPDAPWQLDPSGSVKNIENATVETLRDIQKKYYVPENAALFVGGDVDHEKVYELVNKIYGSWENNDVLPEEIEKVIVKQSATPFEKTKLVVVPYDKISPPMAQVNIIYRGPDSDFDADETYAADLLGFAMAEPEGDFKQAFIKMGKELCIPYDPDYVSTGYSTRRRTGTISFSSVMISNEIESVADRTILFYEKIDEYMKNLSGKDLIVPLESRKKIAARLRDDNVMDTETFKGPLSTLRYNWVSNSLDYYLSYNDKVISATNEDIQNYIKKYIVEKNPIVVVYVNSDVYERTKEKFEKSGFVKVDKTKAFWWQKTAGDEL